jgi:hypothetical protein
LGFEVIDLGGLVRNRFVGYGNLGFELLDLGLLGCLVGFVLANLFFGGLGSFSIFG